jgi:hypothetical protein
MDSVTSHRMTRSAAIYEKRESRSLGLPYKLRALGIFAKRGMPSDIHTIKSTVIAWATRRGNLAHLYTLGTGLLRYARNDDDALDLDRHSGRSPGIQSLDLDLAPWIL